MCRNIHVLHNFDPPATSEEVMAAALQYVRKVAGTTKPSKANEEAFDEAVSAPRDAAPLDHLQQPPPRIGDGSAKARARSAARFATA